MLPVLALTLSLTATSLAIPVAQDAEPSGSRSLKITPASLTLDVGEEAQISAEVVDASGKAIDEEVFFYSKARRSVSVNAAGQVKAMKPGSFSIIVSTARREGDKLKAEVTVQVVAPPLRQITLKNAPTSIYQHCSVPIVAQVQDTAGLTREDVSLGFASARPSVVSVDDFGNLTAHQIGECKITVLAADLSATHTVRVVENPVVTLEMTGAADAIRTGDVVRIRAIARDQSGDMVEDAPVRYSFHAEPDDHLGNAATGQIEQDGRFVAEKPGLYTIVATCGHRVGRTTLRAEPRNAGQKIVQVGHGEVLDVHTSDLWVWEGVDGRDYCVTGTWGANGEALFWDVTDPSQILRIGRVQVDARTVNDVKVSADGTLCVISREGASNRKNGIVLIDVTNPAEPHILSTFTDQLTGGVHNLFLYQNHVFALSAGRRYDIINIDDRKNPRRVGSFELDSPGHSIHDVWVVDGLAYSSNWSDGIQIVDVGNGIKGGTPEKPVKVASYAYPSGWNHAAFPYKNRETGKSYVIGGDEAFPYGLNTSQKPTYPRGWLHFVDFTDLDNPEEVARYQVPEAGSHNFWVEGDVLYSAFYNGGVRAVDISGELMGDLYNQGREIGWFLPTHHEGVIPNASMVWGPQPHKGVVFFSDWNSGLWAVRLEPPKDRPAQ